MKDSVIVLLVLLCEKRRGKQDRYCKDHKTDSARHKHNPELIRNCFYFTPKAKR